MKVKMLIEKSFKLLLAGLFSSVLFSTVEAEAGPDPYMGEIAIFGTNFCPRGWAEANGQLLKISDYNALFSLLGTMYGGDGTTTFALPDLRGRTAIGKGSGPGLEPKTQGQTSDQENIEYAPGAVSVPANPPYVVLNYCIAFQGIYPSRN